MTKLPNLQKTLNISYNASKWIAVDFKYAQIFNYNNFQISNKNVI